MEEHRAAVGVSPATPGNGHPSPAPEETEAPAFELPDHAGGTFRLRDALASFPGGIVVVFFRGHWCPYCRRYLGKLQAHSPRLTARGAGLVAISPEPPATSRRLAAELGLSFPLLSDSDGRVIDRYGTRNGFAAARSLLPHAAVFVVDPAGRVAFKSIDRNYKKRTTVRTILAVLDGVAAGRPLPADGGVTLS